MKTTDPRTLRRFGCSEGRFVRRQRGLRDVLVVLAFGRPTYRHHRYGASLFGDRPASVDRIRRAAQAYARGYARCSRRSPTRLHLAVGTSNFGPGVTAKHGRAWARMVNEANERLRDRGVDREVTIFGGIDVELAWNGPGVTKSWVRGYDEAARWPYYDFGAAEVCPPTGNCWGAWTLEDVWYVAAGASTARPIPQIYTPTGSMARQWFNLALYAHRRHGSAIRIFGVMSQRAACDQSSDSCAGMDNTPQRAWRQLQSLLNSDPRTAQRIKWVTDIRWRGLRRVGPPRHLDRSKHPVPPQEEHQDPTTTGQPGDGSSDRGGPTLVRPYWTLHIL